MLHENGINHGGHGSHGFAAECLRIKSLSVFLFAALPFCIRVNREIRGQFPESATDIMDITDFPPMPAAVTLRFPPRPGTLESEFHRH
jgi:hypothetical protein